MQLNPEVPLTSAPRTARRLLLAFDTGELLVALLGIRYGLLLLGAVSNNAIFSPFLFRALEKALPPVNAIEWGALMFAWGMWALGGGVLRRSLRRQMLHNTAGGYVQRMDALGSCDLRTDSRGRAYGRLGHLSHFGFDLLHQILTTWCTAGRGCVRKAAVL